MSRRLEVDREQVARFFKNQISYFTLKPNEQREVFYELRRRGLTAEQAAAQYRITVTAYQRRMDMLKKPRARREQVPPPGEPLCRGKSELFDLRDGKPQREALDLCARCTVVDWCLSTVKPRSSGFSGVAGGIAWVNGQPLTNGQPKRGGR